jgi:hypothetical protein
VVIGSTTVTANGSIRFEAKDVVSLAIAVRQTSLLLVSGMSAWCSQNVIARI